MKDAAEHDQCYLTSQVHQPECIKVEHYINQLREINSDLSILPMLKDIQGAPKELERVNKPFSALEMCTIIQNLIPGLMKDMY